MLYDFKQFLHWLIDNDVGWAYYCFYWKWFYAVTKCRTAIVLTLHVVIPDYRKVSNIRRTLAGYKIVDHPDVVGASPVGAAPTTSSLSTKHLASLVYAKTATRRETIKLQDLVRLILEILR